jgi:hypothetical protein
VPPFKTAIAANGLRTIIRHFKEQAMMRARIIELAKADFPKARRCDGYQAGTFNHEGGTYWYLLEKAQWTVGTGDKTIE